MTPRKWMSNSCAVLDHVPHSERAKEVELVGNSMLLHDGKILGVKYSPQTDDFFMVGNEMPGGKGCRRKIPRTSSGKVMRTKQMVRSLLFNQYDPLGFVTPYTNLGKMIVQNTMAQEVSFKDPIPKDYLRLWESWLMCLQNSKVRIKRRHIEMGLDRTVLVPELLMQTQDRYGQCYVDLISLVQNMMIHLLWRF